MTIEQKAREIAESVRSSSFLQCYEAVTAARLGIIEGRRQAFEETVAVVQTARFTNPESLRDSIADAIRALIEEQKP